MHTEDFPVKLHGGKHVTHVERNVGSHGVSPFLSEEGPEPPFTHRDGGLPKRTQRPLSFGLPHSSREIGLDPCQEAGYRKDHKQEVPMPPKKKRLRKPSRRQAVGRTKGGESATSRESLQGSRLNDLIEQIDIIVPEVTARVAALEHLLLEKQLCTREELVRAGEFVRILES